MEIEAIGHALAWFTELMQLDGELLLVSDSSYALAACQALQICSANVALVHTVRRARRCEGDGRSIRGTHVKGHSGIPWNELADSLATAALEFPLFPQMHHLVAPWYCDFGRADPIPTLPPLIPLVTPC